MNFLSKSILNLLFLFFTTSLFAQSDFEGIIDFSISYIELPAEMKGYEAMLPKEMSITMKGNKSRIEQSQMMGTNVIVSDMDKKNGFIEMDMGGQKLRMLITTDEFEKEENKPLSNIEYLDETKNILGYACKKAIMKNDLGDTVMIVFYTKEIRNKAQKEFVGLEGFPLQYNMTQQKMTMEILATGINKQTVLDGSFEKNEGFKDISQADLQKMMSGGN